MPCRPAFFLPVRVLSRLFRGLFLKVLIEAHAANRLRFFGEHAYLADRKRFSAFLAPLREVKRAWREGVERPLTSIWSFTALAKPPTDEIARGGRRRRGGRYEGLMSAPPLVSTDGAKSQ